MLIDSVNPLTGKKKVIHAVHPQYLIMSEKWTKYRDVAVSGSDFVEKYTYKFSSREEEADFVFRKGMTACPAYAKSDVIEIKNTIYRSMRDIIRRDGSPMYMEAVDKGVTKSGRSMNVFIGQEVIYELLTMGKVGVFIDRDVISDDSTKSDVRFKWPYLYTYRAEDIKSWAHDGSGELTSVLLRDNTYSINEFGLPDGTEVRYRHLYKTDNGVRADFYDASGNMSVESSRLLNLTSIPFVIFELSQSLLTDVVGHQIAMLNLSSSDMNLAKHNFPFITEQVKDMFDYSKNEVDPVIVAMLAENGETNGVTAQKETDKEILGVSYGKKYVAGLDRPGFIHPSSEPMRASMFKQDSLRDEISQLINISLTNLDSTRASSDSKKIDRSSKEDGLACIAQELEHGEQEIARIWAMYEGSDKIAHIIYPSDYSLKTDYERRQEAKELGEMLPKVPSITFQRSLCKRMVSILLGPHANPDEIKKSYAEIDSAKVIVTDPEVVQMDFESGFVSTETASIMRGYPKGEVEQAKKDHAERALSVALAQSKVNQAGVAASAQDKDSSDPLQRKKDKRAQLANGKQSDVGSNKDIDADPEE